VPVALVVEVALQVVQTRTVILKVAQVLTQVASLVQIQEVDLEVVVIQVVDQVRVAVAVVAQEAAQIAAIVVQQGAKRNPRKIKRINLYGFLRQTHSQMHYLVSVLCILIWTKYPALSTRLK